MGILKSLVACLPLMAAASMPLAVQNADAQTTASATSRAGKPNVVMIYTDDMGYADISSFAKNKLKVATPNIDRLANEGLKMTEFYVSVPICSPSRASVLSGMNGPETQITTFLQARAGNARAGQNDFLDPALAFLPKSFKQGGYATAHVGKWHLGGGRDVDNAPSIGKYGYDEFYSTWESPDRDPKLGTKFAPWDKDKDPGQVERWDRTRYMVDKTLDFMKRNDGKPCFVTLWPDDLHSPFRPSPEMIKKHGGKPNDDRSLENFYGVLEEYDRQIGRLLDGLQAQDMEDNTIIFFTGDNGPNPDYDGLRTDGMRGKKGTLYEGGIREPFIIRWPGHVPAGKENNSTVMCTIDLLPTLTALAGIDVVPEAAGKFDGEDLSKALLGQAVKRTKPVMFAFGRGRADKQTGSPQLAIRDGNMKLLVNRDGSRVELYNLATDRNEKTNIASQHAGLVETLKKQLVDWGRTLPGRTHPAPGK